MIYIMNNIGACLVLLTKKPGISFVLMDSELTLCHEKPIYLLHSANFRPCFMTLFMRITTWMFSCKAITCEQLRANAYSIALETPF